MTGVVEGGFIPLRINKEKQIEMFKKYHVSWTPTIVTLDTEGKEHYRFTGFLSPEEMCARVLLNAAKTFFDLEDHSPALDRLNEIQKEYPKTFAVPEAIFYTGVVQYVSSEEAKYLRQGLDRLREEYPDSEWTLRAEPYKSIDL